MKKNNLSLIIILALNILLAVFVVYPMFSDIKENSNKLIRQKNESHSFLAQINNLREIENFYDFHREDFNKINDQFVDAEIPIDFIAFLERSAQESQVSI